MIHDGMKPQKDEERPLEYIMRKFSTKYMRKGAEEEREIFGKIDHR